MLVSATTMEVCSRFEKWKVAPSDINKENSMKLLAHVFSRRIAERKDLISFFEAMEKFNPSAVVPSSNIR